jgi:hypothetical protein
MSGYDIEENIDRYLGSINCGSFTVNYDPCDYSISITFYDYHSKDQTRRELLGVAEDYIISKYKNSDNPELIFNYISGSRY